VQLNGIAEENRPAVRDTVNDLSQITASLARRIEAISNNLESSSRNLDEFTREVRKSPNRLLFTPEADAVIVEEE
jgi:phospholipid/cholesterol/gamma-HCH transport system substrate-binding protein